MCTHRTMVLTTKDVIIAALFYVCDDLVCVCPLGNCTRKVKDYAFPSVGTIFGIQQKLNKSLILSMNKGKNGVLEMCKIKFYISHISSTTVLDPKLSYRKQIQMFFVIIIPLIPENLEDSK